MLTHFADEMIGVQGSVSNKTHTEEETAFIMAARERLRDYPSAHEMAKLRWVGCTAWSLYYHRCVILKVHGVSIILLYSEGCTTHHTYTPFNSYLTIHPSFRSPGDIKNYLQEKALQSIRQHSTSDSDIFTLQNTTAVSIKADSIL